MCDDDAFVAAVKESPYDDVLRLVYADWLDERDDPRGRFLRLEAEMVRRGESDPAYASLETELAAVASKVDIRWHAKVCRVHVEPRPPFAHPRRHPMNVAGPFYTCGDCMACEAPEHEAPSLMADLRESEGLSYFVRQPRTAAEREQACRAIEVCCVEDLRYGGTDPLVIRKLGNDPRYCDFLIDDAKDAPVDSAVLASANPVVGRFEQSIRPTSSQSWQRREVLGMTFWEWALLLLIVIVWNLAIVLPLRILLR
jgi:uncharacterized protein (TIGR02996 family)